MTKIFKEQFFKKFAEDCKDLDDLGPDKMLKEMIHRWNSMKRDELGGLTAKEAFGVELINGRKRG